MPGIWRSLNVRGLDPEELTRKRPQPGCWVAATLGVGWNNWLTPKLAPPRRRIIMRAMSLSATRRSFLATPAAMGAFGLLSKRVAATSGVQALRKIDVRPTARVVRVVLARMSICRADQLGRMSCPKYPRRDETFLPRQQPRVPSI